MHLIGFQEDGKIQTRTVIFSKVVVACKVIIEVIEIQKLGFHTNAARPHTELLEDFSSYTDVEGNVRYNEKHALRIFGMI